MAEALGKMQGQFNEFFRKFEKKQKIKLILSSILLVATIMALLLYFTKPEYVVLYNNLEPKQAGEVLNILEGSNIKAKFGDSSSSILVSKQDEQRAQVVVATQGLPAARFSYEDAFSGNSFMMTSEERAKRFLYAQQNYLASTIEIIPGIRKAFVNLTIPERTGFVLGNDDRIAKASVILDIEPYASLDPNSIKGIAVLVANAVQDLNPENVTIHGSDGRVLNANNSEGNELTGITDQLNLNQTIKRDLEKSVTDFLSTVYGYGNVVVMANVRLDFDSEITEIKEFSPPIEGETTGIIRSMQELEQNVINEGVGGIPGTDANGDATTQYVEYDQNSSRYSEASRTINYEINELRKKIVKAQGQVKDVTVAVYINSKAISSGELSDTEKRELQNIISAAAGLDTRVVQIGVQEFSRSLEDQLREAMEGSAPRGGLASIPLWLLGLAGALVLGAAFLVVQQTKKRRKTEPLVKEIATAMEVEELDLELSGSQVKQQIEKLVTKKPDAVAQLLRNWLSED